MGLTIATHFCHGHAVKSQLVFGEANIDCGMAKMKKSCHATTSEASVKRKSCCENDYISLGTEKTLESTKYKVDVDPNFVIAFYATYYELIELDDDVHSNFKDYNPPPLIRDVYVLNENFLI